MFRWLKKLNQIVAAYDTDLRQAHARIAELEKMVKDRTNIAVDVGFSGANHVIVIGRYKNADYIQTFHMDSNNLACLIDELRDRSRYGHVRRVDAPPEFRAVFHREF